MSKLWLKRTKRTRVAEIHSRSAQQEIIVLEKTPSLATDVRKEKVLAIRQQLDEGKYDINKRLNAAIDKILENLK